MKTLAFVSALALASISSHASAAIILLGDTTDGPTWNRPVSNGQQAPLSLSAVGTATAYEALSFAVTESGVYSFLDIAVDGWDNYLILYKDAFDALDPLGNAVIANDDFPSIGRSGFNNVALYAGETYFAVTTGFDNESFGAYSLEITRTGAIPEPATWAMLIGGLALVGAAMRRRQSVAVSFS